MPEQQEQHQSPPENAESPQANGCVTVTIADRIASPDETGKNWESKKVVVVRQREEVMEVQPLQQAIAGEEEEEEHSEPGNVHEGDDEDSREPLLIASQHVQFTLRDMLTRIMYSQGYWLYYLAMICVCAVLLLWTVVRGGHPREIWFIAMEAVVNLLMVAEICLRIYLEQKV